MNETEQERQRRAAEEFQTKLRFEKPVAVQVRQTLRNMSQDLATVYAATGTVIDADNYNNDFFGILTPAYRRTTNFFGSQVEKELAANKDDPNHSLLIAAFTALALRNGTTIEQEIERYEQQKNQRMLEFMDREIPISVNEISITNQKELDNAIARANAALVATGAAFTGIEVGRLASQNFRDSSLWRGNTIAATEIQKAAEGAKQVEASVLQTAVRPIQNQELGALRTLKEWQTQGDEKVREAHVIADGQQVEFESAYSVDGESLLFPGDMSLGASAGNTIHCRCSSIQFLEGSIPD